MTTTQESEWLLAVGRELGLEQAAEDGHERSPVADLAETVADRVDPAVAAPTAFLVGVAAGRASDPSVAATDFAQKVDTLARSWNADTERGAAPNDQSRRA